MLDAVTADAKSLRKDLGAGDREKLDGYLDSVRETEQIFKRAGDFIDQPKPQVKGSPFPKGWPQQAKGIHATRHYFSRAACRLNAGCDLNIATETGGASYLRVVCTTSSWR